MRCLEDTASCYEGLSCVRHKAAGGQIMPPPSEVPAVYDDVPFKRRGNLPCFWHILKVNLTGSQKKKTVLISCLANVLWYDPQDI
jgi:hypothetical protein